MQHVADSMAAPVLEQRLRGPVPNGEARSCLAAWKRTLEHRKGDLQASTLQL